MAEQRLKTVFQLRRGTSAEWEAVNPILRVGEPGFATDTNVFKIGDGKTPWKDLKGAVVQVRRNNLYNYEKDQDTFIPMDGEICLVDTPDAGLRVKVGDGVSTFRELDYADTVIEKGYFADGSFYRDSQHTKEIATNTNMLYVDLATAKLCIYDGSEYFVVTPDVPVATEESAGIMKLYKGLGQNEDGTMTQKSIKDELDKKVGATIDGETISFE